MSSSNYNYKLQGKMKLVKANTCMYYKELLKDATNERHQEDFHKKHGNLALKGFDRYDTFLNILIGMQAETSLALQDIKQL